MTKYSDEEIKKYGFVRTDSGYKIGMLCTGCTRGCEMYYTHHDNSEVEYALDGVFSNAVEILIDAFPCNRKFNVVNYGEGRLEFVENPDYCNNPKFHTHCRVIKKNGDGSND
jgi:hypothetical protein